MRVLDCESPEARALWYLLSILGSFGREQIKVHMLERATNGDTEAKNLLDRINDLERAKSELRRAREALERRSEP